MKRIVVIGTAALLLACGCASKKENSAVDEIKIVKGPDMLEIGGGNYNIPRAVIYKTNGDYADKVTIQVDSKGNVTSYPAPSDVKGMEPVALADGWLLTRRGVNASTAFTRYTYAEYAALKSAPTLPELKASIIPDAKITEIQTLSISQSDALANPAAIVIPEE